MKNLIRKVKQGLIFEKIIAVTLGSMLEDNGWLLLEDVHLPTTSAVGYTQIDLVLFTQYRYFCIEAKDWNTTVKCSDTHYWSVEYNRTIKTLSPVHQNKNHIGKLARYLTQYKLEGAVCFNESTVLVDKPEFVYSIGEFLRYAVQMSNDFKVISKEEMVDDYNTILKCSTLSKIDKLINGGTNGLL